MKGWGREGSREGLNTYYRVAACGMEWVHNF